MPDEALIGPVCFSHQSVISRDLHAHRSGEIYVKKSLTKGIQIIPNWGFPYMGVPQKDGVRKWTIPSRNG